MEFMLKKFPADVQQRLANNVFLTGGLARFPGLVERLEKDLREMRPFQSTFGVSVAASPELDAWRGASQFADQEENVRTQFLTRERWAECGDDYLLEHRCSNKYYPSPAPVEKVAVSNPATPPGVQVKEEGSNPGTPAVKEEGPDSPTTCST